MKITILTLIATMVIVGCGGGSGDATPPQNPTAQHGELQELSKIYKDSILENVKTINVKNLMQDTNALSKENYVAYYKRMNTLRFLSVPDLNVTFNLKKDKNTTNAIDIDRATKVIYKNTWSRKDEYTCHDVGTVSKEVNLFPRGHFEADTYKTGDSTLYDYTRCDMGDVTYDGKVEYNVGTSNSGNDITFDGTFGVTPLGTFDSRFNSMSMETESQKITLNGAIRYNAYKQITPEPNSRLTYLEKKYETVGDFVVTVYDKTTGETIQLIYNGILDKVTYRETNGVGEIGASVIDLGVIGKFAYRKTSDYTLRVEGNGKMFTIKVVDNISGLVGKDGNREPPRPVGYDYSNSSSLSVSNHSIIQQVLADGTVRYILDMNTDFYPNANEVLGTPQHTLPLSDVDLMQGVVVIGFDTCPPTIRVRQHFDDLGIEYNYINMKGTQEEYDVFKWFNISGVPYVGINGNFFGGAVYNKNHFAAYLNRYGYDIDELRIDEAYEAKNIFRSASVWFKNSFDELQNKNKYTAMAVANDTPRSYQRYRVWDYNSAEKAKEAALKKCEETRKTRKERGEKEILSKCRLYSVDGVIQSHPIVRNIP